MRFFSTILLATVVALALAPAALSAKPVPSDRCTLLPASELQTVLGQSFGKPVETTAPSPFAGIPEGTDCTYTGGDKVLFRIYVDPSSSVAQQTFARLEPFYPAKSKPPHLGDSAYIDTSQGIHVLKGSVRFYINAGPDAKDQQLIDLATSIAKQL
ncbi:MAG: hypothetical protein JO347_10190 [Candidatus Eremiobacteraeota bacterium]|nr:hypothetical protein [Candidatus Eremiobacteraeota bacterium]MBV8282415.1 hypothetical protein [Candidatus Eremiobacteraeota bacterium]